MTFSISRVYVYNFHFDVERYRILYCVAQPPVPSSYCPISWRLWTWTCTASLCSNKNSEHCIRPCAYLWTREREISVLYTTKMSTLITLYIVHECFEMTMSLYSMRMSYIYAKVECYFVHLCIHTDVPPGALPPRGGTTATPDGLGAHGLPSTSFGWLGSWEGSEFSRCCPILPYIIGWYKPVILWYVRYLSQQRSVVYLDAWFAILLIHFSFELMSMSGSL